MGCYEFLTQALLVFEEEVSDTASQYACIQRIVGTIMGITCLDEENFDTCAQKMTQYSARLLKKPMQCRSIATCAHLLGLLHFQTRKQVALSMVRSIVETDLALTSAEMLNSLFTFIMPLLRDEEDTPASEGEGANFAAEQQLVSRLVHHIRCEDTDVELQILTAAR